MASINLQSSKKIYFASDFHLGYPEHATSLIREKKMVKWLDSIKVDAQVIFLVGDIFDFWFEYKKVIPKGYIRLQGKLAELSDSGIEIVIFSGNHDIWMFDYFSKELGVTVNREAVTYDVFTNNDHAITPPTKFYVVHGDGLGPGDYGYKFLKRVFEHKLSQWAFGWIHPTIGMGLANGWSGSRKKEESALAKELTFRGEGEWLWGYAKEIEQKQHHDFYVFGHRHLLLDMKVNENSRYINLGQWCYDNKDSNHYAVFDGKELSLVKFCD